MAKGGRKNSFLDHRISLRQVGKVQGGQRPPEIKNGDTFKGERHQLGKDTNYYLPGGQSRTRLCISQRGEKGGDVKVIL